MRQLQREAQKALRERFGLEAFRPGQWEAIRTLLSGRDLAAVFPTGAGKSLCYQLPAILMPGVTLVVSPLISLMQDQLASLGRRGIAAAALNSLQDAEERRRAEAMISSGKAKLVYAAPERLASPAFQALIGGLTISMVVVDEAHCITQWDAFRPAYAEIGPFIASLPVRPVICAMTATTDRKTLKAIGGSLGMRRFRTLRLPLVRPNLRYTVRTTLDPGGTILSYVREHAGEKGIIFCTTRLRAEQLARLLAPLRPETDGQVRPGFYHAGMERTERESVQQRFMDGALNVLTATSAFGMGVDIPDIRYVIHDAIPEDLIAYAQQSGRAGRDGAASDCIQLLDPRAVETLRRRYHRDLQQLPGGFLPGAVRARAAGKRALRRRWKKQRSALELFLGGGCIPAGLSGYFGLRVRPCGACERCRRAAQAGGFRPLAPVPDLPRFREEQLLLWALSWQRDALARVEKTSPEKVLSDETLRRAAKHGVLPSDARCSSEAQAAFGRVLARFREEQYR